LKAVIQRVKEAKVVVNDEIISKIGKGYLVLLGVQKDDQEKDAEYLAQKIINLRIFEDEKGKMNLSLADVNGELLIVSQFTLLGDCTKGRRPSFDKAAPPSIAEALYEYFIKKVKEQDIVTKEGKFRAMMQVHLINDGPVTFVIDSKVDSKRKR